jgi:protein-tyrosine phosphatase
MVWEQNSRVIVMVTTEMEGDKLKCHRYWPENLNSEVGRATLLRHNRLAR